MLAAVEYLIARSRQRAHLGDILFRSDADEAYFDAACSLKNEPTCAPESLRWNKFRAASLIPYRPHAAGSGGSQSQKQMAIYIKETPAHIRERLRLAEVDTEAAVLNVLVQQERIERLQAAGMRTELAERLLANFRDLLTLRMAARDRMKTALELRFGFDAGSDDGSHAERQIDAG